MHWSSLHVMEQRLFCESGRRSGLVNIHWQSYEKLGKSRICTTSSEDAKEWECKAKQRDEDSRMRREMYGETNFAPHQGN